MQTELTQSNHDLAHQVATLQRMLSEAAIAAELSGYRSEVEAICERLRRQVNRNLKDLSYQHADVLENVLRQTQRVMKELEILNSVYVGPLLRNRPEDRLALRLLRWLHDEHPRTAAKSFALSNAQFAIYPHPDLPSLYYLPCSRQQTLLYLPLLFHEFGHLLYALHRPEMDDLVAEFQSAVSNSLAPLTVRDGRAAEQQEVFRDRVFDAYYEWCQEFYCDAVGLTIGGPCFLHAFVNYFRLLGSDEFHVPREQQVKRAHPVGWLRVRLLIDRARKLGYVAEAEAHDGAWRRTAELMHAVEDYEGTWSEDLFAPVQKTLDDVLEETSPRTCNPAEASPPAELSLVSGPVAVLNLAWRTFGAGHKSYPAFEQQATRVLEGR